MEAKIVRQINELELGHPKNYNNMSIVPLIRTITSEINYLTLKEALNNEFLTISELNSKGAVPEVKVINNSELPVLLLDGEELVGAKQNRILNTTILLKEKSETIIPVSCTESGRWSFTSTHFKDSELIAACRVRRNKSRSVNESLRHHGRYQSDQSKVWEDIRNLSEESKVNSPTNAMRDVYQAREKEINNYLEAFPIYEDQKGILVIINGEVAGLDFISSPLAYQELHNKLVKSYALDALIKNETPNDPKTTEKLAKKFIEDIKQSVTEKHKSIGYGFDTRFQSPETIGSSLIYKGNIIHAAFFGKDDTIPNGLSTFSKRRSFRL